MKDEGGNIPSYAVDEADTDSYDEHSIELSAIKLNQYEDRGCLRFGFCIRAEAGISASTDIGLTVGQNGQQDFSANLLNLGGGSFGFGGSAYIAAIDAPFSEVIDAEVTTVGGSIGFIGFDYVALTTDYGSYSGFIISIGWSLLPFEFHGEHTIASIGESSLKAIENDKKK